MTQRFEHSDFPSTMTIKTSGGGNVPVIGSLMKSELWFTALEDGLWVGTESDMYHMKIEWRNVGHVIRWLQTQNRSRK